MIPKEIVEKLVNNGVYIFIKGINKEFAGIIKSITEDEIVILEDPRNNITYIP